MITFINGLGLDVIDVPAVRDSTRAAFKEPDDIEYSIRYEDPGFEMILPSRVELTARQKAFLRKWSYENMGDDTSYGLKDLVRELRTAGAATRTDQMHIVVALEGKRHQDIHVDAIYPVDVQRVPPYDGTWVNIPPQDGGRILQMMFDFNEHTPSARTTKGGVDGTPLKPGQQYFRGNKITIRDGKEDTLSISMTGPREAVTFKIRIDYRIGGESRHIVITDRGRPFAITSLNCTDRGRTGGNGRKVFGHVSYDHIWSLRSGDIVSVKNPRRWNTWNC
ncbi:hypothetical protein GCM10022252_29140 [Streptosporangium oxazolinicum]|uniref:FHA domain-containing protein n=1 Tax=Streptosporangium oxazolinicum TaxID=909287 RepID=A0ABP8AUV7_9ACTN